MKIAFIHLSDIHFTKNSNSILDKLDNLISACKDDVRQCEATFVLTTGDIAFSGMADEYDVALDFYAKLLEFYKYNSVHILVAPGNHDCNFSGNNTVRDSLIKSIIANDIVIDDDVINVCCKVQDNYFNFTNCLCQTDLKSSTEKLFHTVKFEVKGKLITFAIYNTSWLSCLHEKYGNVHFPIDKYTDSLSAIDSELVVSVMHHPFSWQGPENSRLMARHIENTSSVVFTGHEHQASISFKSDMLNSTTEYIQGEVLQDNDDSTKSGFNLIKVDLTNKTQLIKQFVWSENNYELKNPDAGCMSYRNVIGYERRKNIISKTHEKFLTDTGMMLNHPTKTDVLLDDIYVYPNMRDRNINSAKITLEHIVNLKELLSASQPVGKYIIFGSEKSGKTALCKHAFTFYHKKGFIPVFIDGHEISSTTIDEFFKTVNSAYKKQYENREGIFPR